MASANASQLAVDLDGVRKRYGELAAVDGVSFAVAQGQTVALVGPSGAGKTTLLRLMAGSLSPDDGAVRLHGRDIGALTHAPRPCVRAPTSRPCKPPTPSS